MLGLSVSSHRAAKTKNSKQTDDMAPLHREIKASVDVLQSHINTCAPTTCKCVQNTRLFKVSSKLFPLRFGSLENKTRVSHQQQQQSDWTDIRRTELRGEVLGYEMYLNLERSERISRVHCAPAPSRVASRLASCDYIYELSKQKFLCGSYFIIEKFQDDTALLQSTYSVMGHGYDASF